MVASAELLGEVVKTDVLVVGGGLAGNNAAIGALEKGLRVLIADKSAIDRCGAIAGGVDHFMAYLGTDTGDTREAYLEWVGQIARGTVNLSVQNAVFCKELKAAIERMERIGCTLKQPDGTYYRTPSMGHTNRIFENPTGIPFNTWQCPANTGAAQAMAYEAGAKLANMEIVRITLVPRGFSAAGLNALTGLGGRIVNAAGEEFMLKVHPAGVRAPRFRLVEAVMHELSKGGGPVYVDCRHLSAFEMTHLKKTLGYDKDTLPDFIEQKGIDLAKEPLEIMPSEGMQGGSSEVNSSGIMIDEKTASTVPGLFAAGGCSGQMRCA